MNDYVILVTIEDKKHFLIECEKYKCDRIEIFKVITDEVPNFAELPDSKSKFIYLM